MLTYGGRSPELVYFLPTIFLWPVQHNLTAQSEDNIIWFFEGGYFPINGLKIYGTFMVDELRTTQIFNNWAGNRWASQIGIHTAGNLFTLPVDLNLEWTAVRPWAYTHRYPAYGSYTHDGRCLGFKYGPNSQLLTLENHWWISTQNILSLSYQQLKRGKKEEEYINDGYHFGSDPNDNYLRSNPEFENKTRWLIGDIETTQAISILWKYQLSNIIDLEVGFSHLDGTGGSDNSINIQVNLDY